MKESKALGGHPIAYCVIPNTCEAVVTYTDKRPNRHLSVSIESMFGRVSTLQDPHITRNGTAITYQTLEALKADGVKLVELKCRHIIDLDEVLPC